MAPFRTTLQLADDGGSTAPAAFKPVKTIVDIYGQSVPVDSTGRNAQGELVIAAESQADTTARRAANVGMGLTPSGATPSGRTITRNAAVRTVNGVKIFTKEVVDADTGEVLNTFEERETPTAMQTAAESEKQAANENAIELLKRTFANYGLESLADTITDFVRRGYKSDTISLMLQDTPAYKQRFAANEARKKAGLAVLSPAEYLATEAAYRQVMSAAGLPKGFYDSASDFQKFLENDMSPSELNQRVQAAARVVNNADPLYKDQLRKLYGLDEGLMTAYALSPENALPFVERRAKAVGYATAAAQQGIEVGKAPAEYYGDLGVTEAQARQGFANIAQTMPTYQKLQQIYGTEGQDVLTNLQAAAFGGTGQAQAEQDILKKRRQEIGQFSGSAGVGQTALSGGSEAGML